MKNEISELVSKLREANKHYRTGDAIISDVEYDAMVERLRKLSPKHSFLKEIGLTPSDVRKQQLPIPMFSLNKVKTVDEVVKWLLGCGLEDHSQIVITPKFDGISLCVEEYSQSCWTRGDGTFGQRSDDHFRVMKTATCFDPIHTFGEAIMLKNDFDEFKKEFSNARNLVAGLFNNKVPSPNLRYVQYVRYGMEGGNYMSKVEQLDFLNEYNIHRCPYKVITFGMLKKLHAKEEAVLFFDQLYRLWSVNFNIDGIVIDIDDSSRRFELGRETNNNPAYARALKMPEWNESQTTIVKDVIFQISKNGVATPVLLVNEIDFDGVIVERVTAHNAAYLIDHSIHPGCEIEIKRSGDVIPKHIKTINFDEFKFHRFIDEKFVVCPSCGNQLRWDNNTVELVCDNVECEERVINEIYHFFQTIGIEDFGIPSITSLRENLGCQTIIDILNLNVDQIKEVEGWGSVSAKKLIDQFESFEVNGIPFAKLLYALNLGGGIVGEKVFQKAFDVIGIDTVGNLISYFTLTPFDDLLKELSDIPTIGNITANQIYKAVINFYDNFNDFSIYATSVISSKQTSVSDKLSGKSFCFTGFRDKTLEGEIISNGGTIASGVSKNTNYLVVKDKNSSSSKAKKAQEIGVNVIDVDELKEMLS